MNESCRELSGPNCTFDLSYVRKQCIQQLNNVGRVHQGQIVICVSEILTEYERQILASRQYILTLWPAFIGFICGFGPDPSDMVLDNVWWAFLFSMTCAGLPGLDSNKPRHYATASSPKKGHVICETHPGNLDSAYPETIPRSYGRPNTKVINTVVRMEWVGFVLCWLLYVAFNSLFGWAIEQAVLVALPYDNWLGAGVWYWISAGPHIFMLASEAVQNRIDLYEVIDETRANDSQISLRRYPARTGESDALTKRSAGSPPAPDITQQGDAMISQQKYYRKVQHKSFAYIWFRIAQLQWQRKYYRVLVRPESDHWIFLTLKMMINMGRITLFAFGSVIMGNILLMPIPYDLYLFVILLFTTAAPRIFFHGIWRSKARGADLIVVCDKYAIGQEDWTDEEVQGDS